METQRKPPQGHEWSYPGAVTQVAVSADGRQIALGGTAGSIEFWELDGQKWRRVHSYVDPRLELPPFALSADGELYAVASPDRGEIFVRRVATGEQTGVLTAPHGKAVVIAFSPRGEVTVGDDTGWIQVWDWDKIGQPFPYSANYRASIQAPTERPIHALAWSPDGQVLTTSERGDPYVCVYLYAEHAWVRTMLHHAVVPVEAIAWRPDSKRVAIAHGTEVEIRARQSRRKPLVTCTGGHAEPITSVSWSSDGRLLLSLGKRGELCVWNAGTGALVGRLDGGEDGAEESDVCAFAVVPGGQVLVGGRNWMAWLFDPLTVVGCRISGEETRELAEPLPWSAIFCSMCCTQDDREEGTAVDELTRIEAGDLVCNRCRCYLATGRPSPSGHPLKDFFAIELLDVYAELDIDAWTLGGCWTSSLGLLRWMQTSGSMSEEQALCPRLMVVEGTRPEATTRIPDHVVVVVLSEDGVPYCLDADGASTQADFLREWQSIHGLNEICLVPAEEQRLSTAGISMRPDVSDRIADALHEQFGTWQPALLSRFSRLTGAGG